MLATTRIDDTRLLEATRVPAHLWNSATKCVALIVLLALAAACSLDQRRTRKKYIAVGNARYARGSFPEALTVYNRVIESDPLNGEAYYRAGITAMRLQNWGDAIRYLQRAIELEPNRTDAYAELGNVYLFVCSRASPSIRAATLPELRSLSEQLHQRFADGYDDHRFQGYLALFAGDRKSALVHFAKAHELKPQSDATLVYLETLLGANQVEEGEALAASVRGDDPALAGVYGTLVAYYLRANRPADVEKTLRKELEKNPNVSEAHLQMAASHFTAHRVGEMKAALKTLATNQGRFPIGALEAGDFYLRIRDVASARESYQLGIDRGGSLKPAYLKRMAEVLVKQHRIDEARKLIEQLSRISADTETRAISASLKVLADDKNQLPAAISEFQSLAPRMPEDFILRYLYGRALLLSGDTRGGIHQLEGATDLRPDYVWARIALARVRMEEPNYGAMIVVAKGLVADEGLDVPFETAGQRPQERPVYEFMLGMRPSSTTAMNDLAAKMAETGYGIEEALAMAKRANQQQPENEGIAANLAWLYIKDKLPGPAIGILKPLVQRNPSSANYRYRLAMALFVKGENSEAKRECEAALQSTKDLDETTSIRELLSRIAQSRS